MALSGKEFAKLGQSAQRQAIQKIVKQRQRERKTTANKYNAKPTDVRLPDGTVLHFASEKEKNRYCELRVLEKTGEIAELRCQVPFELLPRQRREDGKTEQNVRYIADFVYRDGGKMVVEDVKGYTDTKSAAYKLFTVKRKLMLYIHGITIKEV